MTQKQVKKLIDAERERTVNRYIAVCEGQHMQPHERRFFARFFCIVAGLIVLYLLTENLWGFR